MQSSSSEEYGVREVAVVADLDPPDSPMAKWTSMVGTHRERRISLAIEALERELTHDDRVRTDSDVAEESVRPTTRLKVQY